MDADSPEDAPLPPLQIHLPNSSPGYSVPIRAPLTIDSDSEFGLSIHGHIYSRTSSFNSSSSIDISSYGDEHTSNFEEENDAFVAYPDEEIVIETSHVKESSFTRPFVRYPDANYVKGTIFRPFVKIACEESSSDDFGTKLSVPIAPLTQDFDSDTDVDSDGCRWDDSGWIPDDGVVQKVALAPKVKSFNGDEENDELRDEGVFSGDDVTGIENLDSVITESVETEGCKVECLNEVVKLSEPDATSFDLERIDAQNVLISNNEIEIETMYVRLSESDESGVDSERIDAPIVSNSDSEIENLNTFLTEPIENDSERIDVKLSESDEPSFDSERIDAQDSEIDVKTINETGQEVVTEKEEEMVTRMQRVRAKFLRLALNEQLTTKVNREGGNYKFDFNLTVLAIGKTGVGKSATINSIFGESKAITSAFDPGTTTIQEITGNVDGIQLRVIDTPGLKCSSSDRSYNLRILKSIERFTRKHTPNVVLYVDRLDTRDVYDSHLLKLITGSLGSSVWHSCIIALTHASCDLANEPSGGFVVQRCRFIQEQIVSCGGNNRDMVNPVWLVDNHPSYKYDVMELDCGLMGLDCLDQANEDDRCDHVSPFDPLSEPRDRKKAYFTEYVYRVKLLGNNHWSIGCRLCI